MVPLVSMRELKEKQLSLTKVTMPLILLVMKQ